MEAQSRVHSDLPGLRQHPYPTPSPVCRLKELWGWAVKGSYPPFVHLIDSWLLWLFMDHTPRVGEERAGKP